MNNQTTEILLVEDNPNDLELTLHAFHKHRLTNEIHVARDGVEALDFVFGTGPYAGRGIAGNLRLILLDLKLPRIDGLEVLRRLKGNPLTRPIPVVVLTTSREGCDVTESYKFGVNSYIVKPVDFAQFVESARILGMYWTLLNHPPALTAAAGK